MLASVIISVRNDPRIDLCLRSIFELGSLGLEHEFEVIVVENDDTPKLKDIAAGYPVRYYLDSRPGMGYAREMAIGCARGDFLVFTDADCVVSERWLSQLLAPFGTPGVGIVGGPVAKYEPRGSVERSQRDLVIGGQLCPQYLLPIYHRPYVVTANAAYRATAVTRAGGIDPSFLSGGDVDLAWRVGDLGYDLVIAEEAIVYHACRRTHADIFRQFYRYSIGHALLFRKFGRVANRRFCINPYPFSGLLRMCPSTVVAIFKTIVAGVEESGLESLYCEFLEYTGLIAGAIVGSCRHRVLYI